MNKRGLSPVIATVMIILITIVAAAIIAPFVTNFVRDNLEGSGDCFSTLGRLEFAQTAFLCNNVSDDALGRTGFSVKANHESIKGFKASLTANGNADVIEILDGETHEKVRMFRPGEQFGSSVLEVPTKGGVRTYIVQGLFSKIEIFPVLESGKTCDAAELIEVQECSDPIALADE